MHQTSSFFFFFSKFQSVIKYYGNFKEFLNTNPPSPPKQCCGSITLLDASFVHCSSTLLRGRRGEKYKIIQIAVFPKNFVTDCSVCLSFLCQKYFHNCPINHLLKFWKFPSSNCTGCSVRLCDPVRSIFKSEEDLTSLSFFQIS